MCHNGAHSKHAMHSVEVTIFGKEPISSCPIAIVFSRSCSKQPLALCATQDWTQQNTKHNSWSHSHTERELPEVLTATAQQLEQMSLEKGITSRVTRLGFIHIHFTANYA